MPISLLLIAACSFFYFPVPLGWVISPNPTFGFQASEAITMHEFDVVVVPAIRVLRQREVHVASQDDFAKACSATTMHGEFEVERRIFLTGAIATSIANEQRSRVLARVTTRRWKPHWPS